MLKRFYPVHFQLGELVIQLVSMIMDVDARLLYAAQQQTQALSMYVHAQRLFSFMSIQLLAIIVKTLIDSQGHESIIFCCFLVNIRRLPCIVHTHL